MPKKIAESFFENRDDYVYGFADLKGLLPEKYAPFPYALVIGKKLDDRIINSIENGPTHEYLQLYTDTNDLLAGEIEKLKALFGDAGIRCMGIRPTMTMDEIDAEYHETLRYSFSHKMAATRAGLGWIGKTDLLVSHRFGPRLRMATLLFDYSMEIDSIPMEYSKCGSCNLCVELCPGQAATGQLWEPGIDRDEFYSPHKCLNACRKITKERMGVVKGICGICISVCPAGRMK